MKTWSTSTRTPLPYVLRTLYEAQVVEALFQLGLMNRKPSRHSEIFWWTWGTSLELFPQISKSPSWKERHGNSLSPETIWSTSILCPIELSQRTIPIIISFFLFPSISSQDHSSFIIRYRSSLTLFDCYIKTVSPFFSYLFHQPLITPIVLPTDLSYIPMDTVVSSLSLSTSSLHCSFV